MTSTAHLPSARNKGLISILRYPILSPLCTVALAHPRRLLILAYACAQFTTILALSTVMIALFTAYSFFRPDTDLILANFFSLFEG